MHPNPTYRAQGEAPNLALARQRGFGTLGVNGGYGPMLSHVPFWLAEDGARVEMHLVRSNPIARLNEPVPAVLAVLGPDGYISPDWYGLDDQVPTWNYVAVHLRGVLSPMAEDSLRDHLDRLSARFEGELADKPAWSTEKMSAGAMARMMRQILPFQMLVEAIDGTWKLSQNKPDAARLGAAEGVAGGTPGSETGRLAEVMRTAGVAAGATGGEHSP